MREQEAQIQRDEQIAQIKAQMEQLTALQSKSTGQLSRQIHGLNISESMVPAGWFPDDMDQYCRRIGLRAMKDNALDPDEVGRLALSKYFGAKPGDPIGDFISDPHYIVVPPGVVTVADNEQVLQFVDAVGDAMRGGSKGGKNDGHAVRGNWPGSYKAESVVLKLCSTLPLLRRFGATLDRRQEAVRRRNNPCEGSLRAMFFVTPPPEVGTPDHEKQKFRRDLLQTRSTRVFHSLFTYLSSVCREEANPDVDKFFATQEGVYSPRQVCKKATLIFKDLFSLRRRHRYDSPLGLLASLAWLEQLERRNWADPVIDGASLLAPDSSLALDKFEALLGTGKDPSRLAEQAARDAQAVKSTQEAQKKELAAVKKKVDDAKPQNNDALVKELSDLKKRCQRLEQAKYKGDHGGDGDGGGKAGGGKGGKGRNRNPAPAPAPAGDGADDN